MDLKMNRRLGLLDLVGQIDYQTDYDYKAERRRNLKRIENCNGPDANRGNPNKRKEMNGKSPS